MGKASGQTNLSNSFPQQVPQAGVSTPNVQQRLASQPIGQAITPGSPTQLPAQANQMAQDQFQQRGGPAPTPTPSNNRFGSNAPQAPGAPSPMAGQFGESLTSQGGRPQGPSPNMISQALRRGGRDEPELR